MGRLNLESNARAVGSHRQPPRRRILAESYADPAATDTRHRSPSGNLTPEHGRTSLSSPRIPGNSLSAWKVLAERRGTLPSREVGTFRIEGETTRGMPNEARNAAEEMRDEDAWMQPHGARVR